MSMKIVWAASLLCATLVWGLTLTHDLEIPGMRSLTGAEWLAVQHTFFGGYAIVGGIAEVGGLLASGVLAYLVRARRTAFIAALVAAACFAGTLGIFAFGNNPINQQVMSWTPQTLPAGWQSARDAWNSFHAASSVLAGIAWVALLVGVLSDNPTQQLKAGG